MFQPKMKIGEILLKEGLITQKQLEMALEAQKQPGNDLPLGELLVEMGFLTEETLVEFLGKQFNLPYINKNKELLIPEKDVVFENIISKEIIEQKRILPLSKKMNLLKVAMNDPMNLMLLDNLKLMTGYEIAPVIVGKTLLTEAINDFLQKRKVSDQIKKEEKTEETTNLDKIMAEAAEGQVVRVVNLIIMQAVADGVSDIHLEPTDAGLQLRYRLDGELTFVSPPPPNLYNAIVSRIKILSGLDISEKRLPQDGSITMKVEGRSIDMRVSTIPTIYGEKVCIRILDKGRIPLDINNIGIDDHSLADFKAALAKPYGLMLVTGPTGSGKTTTLYACLNYINDPSKNINTIEDPVEYKLAGINQIHVKPEIGLDFAAGLRSFLRQDPDVIMVGEIRDLETAEMCVRAALTGHFVLSTLHTNSAAQSLDRLINIGVEPILIISSMILIVAQRLVRKLCPDCKEQYTPSAEVLEQYGLKNTDVIYRVKGCDKCKNIGYKGRLPIHETLLIDDDIRDLIAKRSPSNEIEK
ncbi:MAG: Flp pilus assembly complex ATPase component TadA, partial [Gammaproteobacteria bacterium]|nr:Flp pilus assembly complex ATPase component TadA [Gammaproteobacteria bacterium]